MPHDALRENRRARDAGGLRHLGVLGAYALLANRLAGISGARNLITCAAVLAIGFGLIALNAIVH